MDEHTTNIVTSMFTTGFNLGGIVGPLLGATLIPFLGGFADDSPFGDAEAAGLDEVEAGDRQHHAAQAPSLRRSTEATSSRRRGGGGSERGGPWSCTADTPPLEGIRL